MHTTRITSERLQKVDDLTRKQLVRTSLFLPGVFDEYSGKSRFITTVLPKKFLQDPSCIKEPLPKFFPSKTIWPFYRGFSVLAFPEQKLWDLENFQNFSKILFQLLGFQCQESCTQLGLPMNACRKSMI